MSAESSSSSNDCSFVIVESSPSTAESSASFVEILSSTAKSSASFVDSSSSAAKPSPSLVEFSSSTAESSNASGVEGEETENATSDESYIIPRQGLNNWMVLRKQLSSSSTFSEGYCVSDSPNIFNVNIDSSASVSSDLDPDVANQILNTDKVMNTGDNDEIFMTSTP